ncbi:MAG: hypothetical protein ABIR00_07715 [Nitrosospira sp.]
MNIEEFLTKLDNLSDSQLITEQHLSAWLQLSLSKIQKDRLKGGAIPFLKPGGAVRYRVGEVRRYLKGVSYNSTSEYLTQCFATGEGLMEEIYGPRLPFFLIQGKLHGFFETLEQDVGEVRWLNKKEQAENKFQDIKT